MSDAQLVDAITTVMTVTPRRDSEVTLTYGSVGKRAAMLIYLAAPEQRFDTLRSIVDEAKEALFGPRYASVIATAGDPPAKTYRESLIKVFTCLKIVRDASDGAGVWDESNEACTSDFQFQKGWKDCIVGEKLDVDELVSAAGAPALTHFFLGQNLVTAALDASKSADKLDAALIDSIRSHLEFVFLFSWRASLLKHAGEAGGIPTDQSSEEYEEWTKELSDASAAVVKYVAEGLDHLFTRGGDMEKEMIEALEQLGQVPTHLPAGEGSTGGYRDIDGYVAPMAFMPSGPDASCAPK